MVTELSTLELSSENQRLAATLFTPEDANGDGILFIHGWRSNQISPRQFARTLSGSGFTCLAFDMRGSGDSEGDLTQQTRNQFLADCLVAYDALAECTSSISVVGSSFGGYLACLLTTQRDVQRLVLRVPANYRNDGFDLPQASVSDHFLEDGWQPSEDPSEPSASIDALSKFGGPVLIVEAADDEMVHRDTVARYAAAARSGTHVVEPGPHSLVNAEMRRRYQELLVNWFSR